MQRFIIESPHLVEQCTQVIQDLHAAGYLHQFEWGCKDNDHTGWAMVEAESLEHAKQMVPWYVREKARIVKIVKFNLEDDVHK